MLEKFMEKELVRKIKIINLLWETDALTSAALASALAVTGATIKNDIKTLNLNYCSPTAPLVVSSGSGYSILDREQNKREVLKRIYRDSLFLRACCFYLTRGFANSERFATVEFISPSKAYDLKNAVLAYVEALGITPTSADSKDECRLRFLITYLQMKIGVEIVAIPKFNHYQFDRLFNEIEEIEKCLFSEYSRQYASVLFQLDYDRSSAFPVGFDQDEKNLFVKTEAYQRLRDPVAAFLKQEFHAESTEDHLLYYVLILNIMNANYIESAEWEASYTSYVKVIKNSPQLQYAKLENLFFERFGLELDVNSILFEAPVITFLRKCMFNLQILIPEEHLELGYMPCIPQDFITALTEIFHAWNNITGLPLLYSADHLKYLASKLYFPLHRRSRPEKIYILTSFYTDYLLAKEILSAEYGALIQVAQFVPKVKAVYTEDDLILYDTNYPILEKLPCKKLQVSFIFDLAELQAIREYLFEYDLSGITRTAIVETED